MNALDFVALRNWLTASLMCIGMAAMWVYGFTVDTAIW